MTASLNAEHSRLTDIVCLAVALLYLGAIFFFSSAFYLATEDYEAINAIRLIGEGTLIGKSTGWPYTPLSGYLFYLASLAVDATILNLRFLTVLIILASVFPIYFTIRSLSSPFVAFALTLFSFSLSTFPHPRLEYYIEAALVSFGIYYGVRFVQKNRKSYLYASAAFTVLAFSAKGYPNAALLLFLMPLSLSVAKWIVANETALRTHLRFCRIVAKHWLRRLEIPRLRSIVTVIVGMISTGALMAFLKGTVYQRSFTEYVDVNDLIAFPSKRLISTLSWLLLLVFLVAFFSPMVNWRNIANCKFGRRISPIVFPFLVCSALLLLIAVLAGYSFDDLMFFVFPSDIFLDHTKQISERGTTTVYLFAILWSAIMYLFLSRMLSAEKAEVSFFLLLIFPCTFARFFPGYNMLYLGSFLVTLFVSLILPAASELFLRKDLVGQLQRSVAIFLIIYSVGSNLFLLVITQWSDRDKGRLVRMTTGPLRGIFVEDGIARFFQKVHTAIGGAETKAIGHAFLSNSYLKYVPLAYGYGDALAGQNLITGLGRLWSYDDIFTINADGTAGADRDERIYSWRQAAVQKMKEAHTQIIIMSLYDKKLVNSTPKPSSDPLRQYLQDRFVLAHVIEPEMKQHRRSRFAEGAVIFLKQPKVRVKTTPSERRRKNE